MSDRFPHRVLAGLGWGSLLLALPLAFLAMVHGPNKYAATLGIDALDCDGPMRIYLLVLPAMLLYAAGFLINIRRRHKGINLIVAVLCFMICAALAANAYRAVVEERRQAAACRTQ